MKGFGDFYSGTGISFCLASDAAFIRYIVIWFAPGKTALFQSAPIARNEDMKMVNMHGPDNVQLSLLKSVADGIAALFFPSVEVVIHDVEAGTVAYIANNLSKRKPGDDAGLDDFQQDKLAPVSGPYEKLNWDGKKMRSITIATGDDKTPGYLLCINLCTAVFEDARNALDMFLSVTRLQPQPEQLFRDDWQENINTFLHEWIRREGTSLSALTREQKKNLVQSMHSQGAFRAKNAADYIAGVLSLGRTTVYKYLRELKKQ